MSYDPPIHDPRHDEEELRHSETQAKTHPPFNLESVYDTEIFPPMSQIIDICKRHKMPMLATFMYQHHHGEEELDSYCTTSLGGESDWKPDKLIKATEIIRRNDSLVAAFAITRG